MHTGSPQTQPVHEHCAAALLLGGLVRRQRGHELLAELQQRLIRAGRPDEAQAHRQPIHARNGHAHLQEP